jgi:hypothetical protein
LPEKLPDFVKTTKSGFFVYLCGGRKRKREVRGGKREKDE